MVRGFSVSGGLPRLPRDPLPNLCRLAAINKDDEMLVGRFGHLLLDFLPCVAIWNLSVVVRLTRKNLHATLFCEGVQQIRLSVNLHVEACGVSVPAQFFDKELLQFEVLQIVPNPRSAERHASPSPADLESPSEQMIRGSLDPSSSWIMHRRPSSRSSMTRRASSASLM